MMKKRLINFAFLIIISITNLMVIKAQETIDDIIYENKDGYIYIDKKLVGASCENLGIDSCQITSINDYNEYFKTGDTVTINNENYKIVVKGDITSSQKEKPTVTDVAKLYQFLKGKIEMEDYYQKAGDLAPNYGEIKINDITKLFQYVKGKIDFNYNDNGIIREMKAYTNLNEKTLSNLVNNNKDNYIAIIRDDASKTKSLFKDGIVYGKSKIDDVKAMYGEAETEANDSLIYKYSKEQIENENPIYIKYNFKSGVLNEIVIGEKENLAENDDSVEVYFLNVYNNELMKDSKDKAYTTDVAEAIIIKTKDNKYILIDTGNDIDNKETDQNVVKIIYNKLIALQGKNDKETAKIDYLIISHDDSDHCGNIDGIFKNTFTINKKTIKQFDVGTVIYKDESKSTFRTKTMDELLTKSEYYKEYYKELKKTNDLKEGYKIVIGNYLNMYLYNNSDVYKDSEKKNDDNAKPVKYTRNFLSGFEKNGNTYTSTSEAHFVRNGDNYFYVCRNEFPSSVVHSISYSTLNKIFKNIYDILEKYDVKTSEGKLENINFSLEDLNYENKKNHKTKVNKVENGMKLYLKGLIDSEIKNKDISEISNTDIIKSCIAKDKFQENSIDNSCIITKEDNTKEIKTDCIDLNCINDRNVGVNKLFNDGCDWGERFFAYIPTGTYNTIRSNSNSLAVLMEVKNVEGSENEKYKYMYFPNDIGNSGIRVNRGSDTYSDGTTYLTSCTVNVSNTSKDIGKGNPSTYECATSVNSKLTDEEKKNESIKYVFKQHSITHPDLFSETDAANNIAKDFRTKIDGNIMIYQVSHHGYNNSRDAIDALKLGKNTYAVYPYRNNPVIYMNDFLLSISYHYGLANIPYEKKMYVNGEVAIKCTIGYGGSANCIKEGKKE